MVDLAEHKPKNRSYFAASIRVRKEEWMTFALAVAAYFVTMGIGFLLYPKL